MKTFQASVHDSQILVVWQYFVSQRFQIETLNKCAGSDADSSDRKFLPNSYCVDQIGFQTVKKIITLEIIFLHVSDDISKHD